MASGAEKTNWFSSPQVESVRLSNSVRSLIGEIWVDVIRSRTVRESGLGTVTTELVRINQFFRLSRRPQVIHMLWFVTLGETG